MRTTIVDVKFDEESKSALRNGVPCKKKSGKCRKKLEIHNISCRKKRRGKISSLPITI